MNTAGIILILEKVERVTFKNLNEIKEIFSYVYERGKIYA